MNTRLLRRVAKRILAEPRQFQMGTWFATTEQWAELIDGKPPKRIPNCGTAACIAGWVIAESAGMVPSQARLQDGGVIRRAIAALQLSEESWPRLFGLDGWPEKFRRNWKRLSYATRATRAAARIEHFIATKGAE